MIPKREAQLKASFSQELKQRLPSFSSLLLATAGAPDRCIIGAGRTTFLEFKHGTPSFDSPGNQELCCMRLEIQGHCRYVIWHENAQGTGQCTLIVRPRMVHERTSWMPLAEHSCPGFSHAFVIDYLKQVHNV